MMNKFMKKMKDSWVRIQSHKRVEDIRDLIDNNLKNETKNKVRIKNTAIISGNTIKYIFIFGLCFIIILPLIQQLSLAFRAPEDLNNPHVVWIPANWSMLNIKISIITLRYWEALLNTFLVSLVVMTFQILTTGIVGYSFARLKFKGSNLLFYLVIAIIVIPPQTLALPQFLYFKDFDVLGLFNLFTGSPINMLGKVSTLIIMSAFGMGIKSGLFIYIFRQFFKGLPADLEESAQIDGAGVFRTFWSVMLPNAKGAILTVGLFAFVWQWNDVYYSSLFQVSTPDFPLLTMRLANAADNIYQALFYSGALNLVGEDVLSNPFYFALVSNTSAIMMMLPLLIMYIFVQRYFVESIERTGIVG